MDKNSIMSFLYAKRVSPLEFKWETMVAPPLLSLLNINDIFTLNKIAMSNKLASRPKEKYQLIKSVLEPRGFKYLASGTNRVIYKYLEDQSFCLKVALDRVGVKDNPMEYANQFKLKPFVAKTFESTPCGTIALSERVKPITSREEYKYIASDVFDFLIEKIIGKYVVDDIGTNFFQNIGIRVGWGPVLLDYPYVYELDGNKLLCNWQNPYTQEYCLGEIDYDAGFNYLVCNKCGKQYQARQLQKQVENKSIIVQTEGVSQDMRFEIFQGNKIIDVIESKGSTKTILPEQQAAKLIIKNKKFVDESVKREQKALEKQPQIVKEATEKRQKHVQRRVSTACSNLYSGGEGFKEEEKKVEVVDVTEIAKDVCPNYTGSDRFPRVNNSEVASNLMRDALNKALDSNAISKSVEVEDGTMIANHLDMVNEAKRLGQELAERKMREFHQDDEADPDKSVINNEALDKPVSVSVERTEALEDTVPPKINKAAEKATQNECNQNTSVKNYAYPDNPIKNPSVESDDGKRYYGGYSNPTVVSSISIDTNYEEVLENY